MRIQQAHVRRTLMIDGRLCGEVEVQTDDPGSAGLLVYMAAAPDGGFEVVRVVENDASLAIDWYDNPMHQAFTERTAEEGGAGWNAAGMAERVLACGTVREDLERATGR